MEKTKTEAAQKKPALSKNKKIALILGALAVAAILAFILLWGGEDDVGAFSDFLYNSPKSGIIMDVRSSTDAQVSSNIMQCGVNLISGGFFASQNKDLLIYACDEKGCLAGGQGNATDATQSINGTAKIEVKYIPFDEALFNMRSRAYFHILYSNEASKKFYPNHVEVFMNASSNPADCGLKVR